jgi:hypothetical protein
MPEMITSLIPSKLWKVEFKILISIYFETKKFQVKHIVTEMSKRVVEGDEFEGQSPFRSAHEVTRYRFYKMWIV